MEKSKKKKSTNREKWSRDLTKSEYTEEQKARIANYLQRSRREPVRFTSEKNSSGIPRIRSENTDNLLNAVKLTEAFGTPNRGLQKFLLNQVIQTFYGVATSQGSNSDKLGEFCNIAVAILNGIQPQDELEGMLAIQMIGVHNLAMETMRRAMITGQTLEGKQANVNEATKMLRTYTAQMEALKRYRTGGQQKVTVEHVHVNEGGQAIVGTVNQGGGGSSDKKRG
jgi:hypothetical protein